MPQSAQIGRHLEVQLLGHGSKSGSSRHANLGAPKAEESPVGKVVMYSSVSVDGFVADEEDQPGPAATSRWTRAAS